MKLWSGQRRQRWQSGDTIVEVLISIIVIATILTGAFVVSRQSTRNLRASEEHSEALNLLQGQIEKIRNAATVVGVLPLDGSAFCMSGSRAVAASSAACTLQEPYQIHLSAKQIAGDPNTGEAVTFQATASWPGLDNETNQVQLVYKTPITLH